ncbi:MAG: immunoglobulin-like domain-containing protein [Bacteroidota bacterium]
MKHVLKSLLLIAIAISVATLISCNKDEEVPEVVASFIANITAGTGDVSFENTSENATSYSWDFGDGETSELEDPSHTYAEAGNYSVKLTASNAAGDSDTFTDDITITITDDTAPVITLVGDETLCLNVGDTYTDPGATATDDTDGDITSSIVVGGDAVDTGTPGIYEVTYNVSDAEGNAATQVTRGVVVSAVFNVEGNLLSNGDFNDGATGWTGNQGALEIRTEGCSNFFFANIATAGNSYDVNLQQVVELTQDQTYTLTFDANSDVSRSIIAGIGLNEGDYPSVTETVALTTEPQTFTIECLFAGSFGGANSRVFFDLGAETGVVIIDNVALVLSDACEAPSPTTAAPTPATDPGDVISIFSDAYTNISGVNTNPNWGQATVSTVEMIESNNTLKYANLTYQGTDWTGNAQDVSGKKFLHIDMWTANATAVNISIISTAGPTEKAYSLPITTDEWVSYDILLTQFSGVALSSVDQMKFDAPGAPTIYLDNIYFYGTADGGGGGTPGAELTINGDFETGDATGWTSFAVDNNGTFTVTDVQKKDGTYSGLLKADVDGGAGGASFPIVKQANIGIGTVTANATVTVSFDLFGSLAGAGGVVFAELFSELDGGGVSKSEILGAGPVFPNGTWTTYSFTTTLGDDVAGGITLQLKSDCGANTGCVVEAYFDNVSIKVIE